MSESRQAAVLKEETEINQITTKTNVQLHYDSAVMGRSLELGAGTLKD